MVWAIYALLSAVFFSAKDIIAKQLFLKKEIEHKHILFHEYVFYFVILIFFIPFINFSSIISHWYLYVFKAFAVGGAGFLYFKLLKEHDISLIAPLLNLSPLILLLLSSIILSEQVTKTHIIGIFVMVIATYYLEVVLQHHHREKAHKHHWYTIKKKSMLFFGAILCMLTAFSLAAIADRLVLEQVNVPTNLFFTSCILLVVLILVYKPKIAFESIKQIKSHPKVLLFGALMTLSTGLVLLAINVPAAQVSLIIPLRRSATLFSALFGGLLFHEKKLPQKIGAIIVMLVGIILLI